MHFLYFLYSEKVDRYYVGESANAEERLQQHNSGEFKGSYTKIADDWTIKLSITFKDRTAARHAEAFLKKMNSRKLIEKLLIDHQWLIEKFG